MDDGGKPIAAQMPGGPVAALTVNEAVLRNNLKSAKPAGGALAQNERRMTRRHSGSRRRLSVKLRHRVGQLGGALFVVVSMPLLFLLFPDVKTAGPD